MNLSHYKLIKGILFAILSCLLFSLMNICTKHLSTVISVPLLLFFRGFLGAIIVFPYLMYRRLSLVGQKPGLLVFRGLIGAIAALGQFYAIANIKLGDASILANTTPIFVILLAHVFLHERLQRTHYLLLILSILGALLVIKPGTGFEYSIYSSVGLLSAFLTAVAYVAVKALSGTHSSVLITFYFMIMSATITLPFIQELPQIGFTDAILIVSISLLALLAQVSLTKAFKFEKAGVVSMSCYIGIVFNIGWGYFLWQEVLDIYSVTGGLLIVGSSIFLIAMKNRQALMKMRALSLQ